jgi:hypothetical protein
VSDIFCCVDCLTQLSDKSVVHYHVAECQKLVLNTHDKSGHIKNIPTAPTFCACNYISHITYIFILVDNIEERS